MFSRSIITLVALAGSALAQLTVQTPAALIQCQPALLSWTGGSAPYFLAAIPGGQPSAAALKDFGQQSGNSITWTVDIASGTSITLKVTDSTGVVNYNQAVTIQAGSSSACLNAASSSAVSSVATPVATSTNAAVAGVAGGSSAVTSALSSASAAVMSASATSAAASTSAMASSAGAASKASSAAASGASAASSAKASGTSAAASAAASATKAASSASQLINANNGLMAVVAGVMVALI
ncbi:hypothetical protein CI109_101814 [Kwoniella shandongensis]|uniref:Uncharacterized protein n=1 Tax=Kwoniella shandongensis TaxID=1734106 RepID=A0A5M6C588_9TREE|nr:uncharacterized protein CI109_001064 [Kwoniella shandongensis]KAA5530264.1 hypothetical protein CI109_001064 [Kwoniella shandongensis]